MVSLFDNDAGSWSTGVNLTSNPWEIGSRFTLDADAQANALLWHRAVTGAPNAPTRLRLWDLNTHTQLAELTSLDDSGAVGWQSTAIPLPVYLVAGHTYAVTAWWPTGVTLDSKVSGDLGSAPAPLNWSTACRGWRSPSGTGEPNASDNAIAWGVDVDVSANPGAPDPSSPPTVGNIEAVLSSWFSSDANDHEDALPFATKVAVDLANDNLSALADSQALIKAVTDELGPYLPGWATTLLGLDGWLAAWDVDQWARLSDRLLGASGGGGSAFYGPNGQQVSAGVEALLARSTNAMAGFPSAPWELIDETDWDDALAWAVPADLYVVTFTTIPDLPENGRAGVPTRYRLAWWSPLNGEFARERRWIDFPSVHLVDPAGRMPGLLLQTYDLSGAGHVQAWQLNT